MVEKVEKNFFINTLKLEKRENKITTVFEFYKYQNYIYIKKLHTHFKTYKYALKCLRMFIYIHPLKSRKLRDEYCGFTGNG